MTTIYRYRIRCITDNLFEYVLSESAVAPTACPTNTSHTIDADSTVIAETITIGETVSIKEEYIPTGGNFKTETIIMNISASSTFEADYTWPYPISLLVLFSTITSTHEGDNLEITVAPNTTVGLLTSNVSANDTTISVSQTVIDNLYIGYKLKLDDGSNVDDLGYVTAINKVTNQVTVNTPAVHSFDSSNTAVKMTIYYVENFEIGAPANITIGKSKIGASYIPAGTIIHAKYTNNNTDTKKFIARLEYLY
jgi:hypothetical protein